MTLKQFASAALAIVVVGSAWAALTLANPASNTPTSASPTKIQACQDCCLTCKDCDLCVDCDNCVACTCGCCAPTTTNPASTTPTKTNLSATPPCTNCTNCQACQADCQSNCPKTTTPKPNCCEKSA